MNIKFCDVGGQCYGRYGKPIDFQFCFVFKKIIALAAWPDRDPYAGGGSTGGPIGSLGLYCLTPRSRLKRVPNAFQSAEILVLAGSAIPPATIPPASLY